MLDIIQLKQELTDQFPEYSFFTTRRLTGRCIVAKKSKYHGADIKNDRIVVEPAIPDWTTRLMLGAGAAYKKMTDDKFAETAIRITDYLSGRYEVSIRR